MTAGQRSKGRGNGEGSIYQRSDGKWCAAITLEFGKRRVLYGRTRKDVAEKLAVALRDVQQGLPIPGKRLTTERFLTDWLEHTVAGARRPKTWRAYEFAVRVHIVPRFGSVPVAKLSPEHVQRLQRDMEAKGLSPATIALVRAVLGTALRQATKWGLVARNPVPLVDAPSGLNKEAQVLNPEQARRLLEAAVGDDFDNLLRFMLSTGLRIGEALGLRWADIDDSYRELRVRQQLVELPGEPKSFGQPKSASGRRVVPIIPTAADALHAERARMLKHRLRAADLWQDHGLVFCNELGGPYASKRVREHLHRLVATAGLPERTTPHTLRHSAATFLLAAGVADRVVMEIMGHSSIAMTSRYEHVLSEMVAGAGDKLARFFSAASA